jgi:hypothetical protein
MRLSLPLLFFSAALFAGESPLPDGFDASRSVQSSHFILYHESAYAPVGILGTLEGLHAKLLLDLQPFAPGQEKIKVFVYADGASYVAKTGIPAWSAAFANPETREIHCHEDPALQRILAHEMSHLLFMPYFKDAARPPAWLNEGLAKAMEYSYGQSEDTRHMNSAVFSRGGAAPLSQLMSFDYHDDPASSPRAMSLWYEQSASVTGYLLRRFPQSQFVAFCDALRKGKSADEALKAAYGFQVPDTATLERLWRESLSEK